MIQGAKLTANSSLLRAPVGVEQNQYSIYDFKNPRSVINIVPLSLREAIIRIPNRTQMMSETELHKYAEPSPTIGRLRLSFWDEYGLAQDQGRDMQITAIIRNIISFDYWEKKILPRTEWVAFIVMPPKDYMVSMRYLHRQALKRLEEILDLPVLEVAVSKSGRTTQKINVSLISQIIRITQMLESRVMGAVVQKNLNLNVSADPVEKGDIEGLTLEQIDKKLFEIKKQMGEPPAKLRRHLHEDALSIEAPVEDGEIITDMEDGTTGEP